MALTATINCTHWGDYTNGNLLTTRPSSPSIADFVECNRWEVTYTGVLDTEETSPITSLAISNFPTQPYDVNIESTDVDLPVTLEGTDNRVFLDNYANDLVLDVNQLNPVSQSGSYSVQLDSYQFPIPVIDYRTSNVTVDFASGAVLATTEPPILLSDTAKEEYLSLTTGVLIFALSLFIVFKVFWTFFVRSFRWLTRRLW